MKLRRREEHSAGTKVHSENLSKILGKGRQRSRQKCKYASAHPRFGLISAFMKRRCGHKKGLRCVQTSAAITLTHRRHC